MLDQFASTFVMAGDLNAALEDYRESLAIRQRLAAGDAGNTRWQAELARSYHKVGGELKGQSRLDEALKMLRDGLAVRQRLAAVDPADAQAQRALAISDANIADV